MNGAALTTGREDEEEEEEEGTNDEIADRGFVDVPLLPEIEENVDDMVLLPVEGVEEAEAVKEGVLVLNVGVGDVEEGRKEGALIEALTPAPPLTPAEEDEVPVGVNVDGINGFADTLPPGVKAGAAAVHLGFEELGVSPALGAPLAAPEGTNAGAFVFKDSVLVDPTLLAPLDGINGAADAPVGGRGTNGGAAEAIRRARRRKRGKKHTPIGLHLIRLEKLVA